MKIYLLLNKPVGYSTSHTQNPSIFDLLPQPQDELAPANRLDDNSEGVVLMTNDVDFFQAKKLENEFEITIDDYLSKPAIKILSTGMVRNGEIIRGVELIGEKHKGNRSVVTVIARETNDTEIRKMFEAIGYHVVGIRCTRFDKFKLGVLPIGKWKKI